VLDHGQDQAVFTDYTVRASGTALLFAGMLMESTTCIPNVIASVGYDMFGTYLLAELEKRGISTARVHVTHQEGTALVFVARRDDHTRLMFQSKATASRVLNPDFVADQLATIDSAGIRLLWISGYCLTDRSAPRLAAVRVASEWARRWKVPIVVDLVPHDFQTQVGDHHSVESMIGPVDGLVGELHTVQRFALSPEPGFTNWQSLEWYARALCEGRRFAMVQHRISTSEYGQVTASCSGDRFSLRLQLESTAMRGIGDRLAILGMKRLRLLR
jgi:hypothetical protein